MFDHNEPAHLEAVLRAAIAEGQPRTGRAWKKIVSGGGGGMRGVGGWLAAGAGWQRGSSQPDGQLASQPSFHPCAPHTCTHQPPCLSALPCACLPACLPARW